MNLKFVDDGRFRLKPAADWKQASAPAVSEPSQVTAHPLANRSIPSLARLMMRALHRPPASRRSTSVITTAALRQLRSVGKLSLDREPPPHNVPLRVELTRSTNLRTAAYDPAARVLTIEFRDDAIYRYGRVPLGIYVQLIHAKSPGSYFATHIRNQYPFSKIK